MTLGANYAEVPSPNGTKADHSSPFSILSKPMFSFSKLTSLSVLLLLGAGGLSAEPFPESTEDARAVAAMTKLSGADDLEVIYAKGLCCPSCAIGIRKKVSKLNFVDRERFNKGVDLDPKFQLVSIAIKDGQMADYAEITQAILDAGYDPVQAYLIDNDAIATRSIVPVAAN